MFRVEATLLIQGDGFSPRAIEKQAGVRFTTTSERGELARTGRYAGKPIPYGAAELVAHCGPDFLMVPDERFFSSARQLAAASAVAGPCSLRLHVDVIHDGQCNLEFGHPFLDAVRSLGVPFTMTCYESEIRDLPRSDTP